MRARARRGCRGIWKGRLSRRTTICILRLKCARAAGRRADATAGGGCQVPFVQTQVPVQVLPRGALRVPGAAHPCQRGLDGHGARGHERGRVLRQHWRFGRRAVLLRARACPARHGGRCGQAGQGARALAHEPAHGYRHAHGGRGQRGLPADQKRGARPPSGAPNPRRTIGRHLGQRQGQPLQLRVRPGRAQLEHDARVWQHGPQGDARRGAGGGGEPHHLPPAPAAREACV
jgi:hypothetical protein